MSYKTVPGWNNLTGYQRSIVKDTGCAPEEAPAVEDIMRNDIFHSTLDWQTAKQFRKGAREAYEVMQYLRTHCTEHIEELLPCKRCKA